MKVLSSKLLKEITKTTNKEADNMSHEFVMPGKVITGKVHYKMQKMNSKQPEKGSDRIW